MTNDPTPRLSFFESFWKEWLPFLLLFGCIVGFGAASVVVWRAARKSEPKKPEAKYSPFVLISGAELHEIAENEGFTDNAGFARSPHELRVPEVDVRLTSMNESQSFVFRVNSKPSPFNVTIDNDWPGWVGPPSVRAVAEGDSIGMIFNGCGHGLAHKYSKAGQLLKSFEVEGHVHAVGCLAPKKRRLCIFNSGPNPVEPSRAQIHVFDWDDGKEVAVLTLPSTPSSAEIAVSRDERYLFVDIRSSKGIYRVELP